MPLLTSCVGLPLPNRGCPVITPSSQLRVLPIRDTSPPALACMPENTPALQSFCAIYEAETEEEPVSSKSPSPTLPVPTTFESVPVCQSLCVVTNVNLAAPALCKFGGILKGRLINRIGRTRYLNCEHASTPLNRPAVPAHVCTCPLHDPVGHTRAV